MVSARLLGSLPNSLSGWLTFDVLLREIVTAMCNRQTKYQITSNLIAQEFREDKKHSISNLTSNVSISTKFHIFDQISLETGEKKETVRTEGDMGDMGETRRRKTCKQSS